MKAACDSGPFIHLAQIGLLKVFTLFHTLYTTPYVIAEISKGAEEGIHDITLWKNVEVRPVLSKSASDLKIKLKKYALQDAEISVLCLNKQYGVPLFLTDDLDARSAALEIGFKPHGSVGLIVRAYRRKLLTLRQAENSLVDLYEKSSLFVTRGIVDAALQKLNENR